MGQRIKWYLNNASLGGRRTAIQLVFTGSTNTDVVSIHRSAVDEILSFVAYSLIIHLKAGIADRIAESRYFFYRDAAQQIIQNRAFMALKAVSIFDIKVLLLFGGDLGILFLHTLGCDSLKLKSQKTKYISRLHEGSTYTNSIPLISTIFLKTHSYCSEF